MRTPRRWRSRGRKGEMGLCIVPGGAEWGYIGFMRFRRRLALAEGIDLYRCESYVELMRDRPGYYLAPDYRTAIHHDHVIRWRDLKTPLRRLLNHSDCDGFLTPKECARILPRLRTIVESWPDRDARGEMDYDKQEGRKLVTGMEMSVATGRWMRFR